MKKLALSLAIVAMIVTTLSAQDEDQSFHFGLKASPAVVWTRIDGDSVKNDAVRIGFTYGLMMEFKITKNYSFSTGIDISYRGGKYSQSMLNIDGSSVELATVQRTQKLQFFEIPIGLKLKTNEIGYMKYYGTFGMLPGILVKATEDIESDNASVQVNRNKRGNQSDFYFFDASLMVGLGIEYNLGGSTAFTAGIHYINGLIDVWKDKNRQMRSDGVVLNIGVFF